MRRSSAGSALYKYWEQKLNGQCDSVKARLRSILKGFQLARSRKRSRGKGFNKSRRPHNRTAKSTAANFPLDAKCPIIGTPLSDSADAPSDPLSYSPDKSPPRMRTSSALFEEEVVHPIFRESSFSDSELFGQCFKPEVDFNSHLAFTPFEMQSAAGSSSQHDAAKKSRGRPPTYVWRKDEVLTEDEQKKKNSIEKRRERQKRSYYKKKSAKRQEQAASNRSLPDFLLDDHLGDLHVGTASGSKSSRSPDAEEVPEWSGRPLVVVREYHSFP